VALGDPTPIGGWHWGTQDQPYGGPETQTQCDGFWSPIPKPWTCWAYESEPVADVRKPGHSARNGMLCRWPMTSSESLAVERIAGIDRAARATPRAPREAPGMIEAPRAAPEPV
jgi:hypothetical protein